MQFIFLSLLLVFARIILSLARNPSLPFPSCLVAGVTWDSSHVLDLVIDVGSPEVCQLACSEDKDCVGFTWLSEHSDLLDAHSCVLFSKTGEEIPHENVISGPSLCSCTVSGECKTGDHNVIDVVSDTLDVSECRNICEDNSGCVAYTFLGEEHPLGHLCVLYSSCENFDENCTECTTGVPACQTCTFEETVEWCGIPAVCSNNATTVSQAPHVSGFSSIMVLCDDPQDQTCESDLLTLCPTGFHLCSHLEFNVLNENWNFTAEYGPVGEIYCRHGGGAGHFSIKQDNIQLSIDEPMNCYRGSSRHQCPTVYGCSEKFAPALCCSKNPTCGNTVVDSPLEECDDGNTSDDDDCLSSCTWRVPYDHEGGSSC